MKFLIAALLILVSSGAWAHDCDPPNSACPGTTARTITTPAGDVTVRWLQYTDANTPAGMVSWRMYRWVDLIECRWTAASILAAAARVAAKPSDPYAQFKVEMQAAIDACVATPGTTREYEFKRLLWLGCESLRANPPPGTPTGWLPADWCGVAPQPPAPPPPPPTPAGVYIVSGAVAYPLRADGTRSTTAWPTAPTKGEACDCSVLILNPYGGRFCKVPRLSTTQTVVAGCTLRP